MDTKLFVKAFWLGIFFTISVSSFPAGSEETNTRFTKETEQDKTKKVDVKKTSIIDDLQSILDDSTKLLKNIIEVKTRVIGPLLDGLGKTLDSLNESEAIEKTAEAVGSVGSAGIKASTGLATVITKSGNPSAPSTDRVTDTAIDVGGRLFRLGVCGIVCPLRNGDEREECYKKHCGKRNKKMSTQNKRKKENKELAEEV